MCQRQVRDWVAGPGLVIVCGRFEGIDQRVIDARGLLEVSIGDYVLTGGEIPAMVLIDAISRHRDDLASLRELGSQRPIAFNCRPLRRTT